MKKAAFIIASLAFAIIIASCGGKKDKNESNQDSIDSSTVQTPEIFKYPVPTSFELTEMLNKTGAAYIFNINDSKKVDKYNTETEKAVNLGVFGADLCYSSTYNMKQETMLYLEASKKLSDQLEINSPFNETFAERLEANIENTDSTYALISQSIEDTYDYLKSNNKDDLSLLVMTGSIVEGLFIATQVATLTPNNADIVKVILEQKESLSELLKLMEASENADVKTYKEKLVAVDKVLQGAGETLTKAQLDEISKLVSGIRTSIVK
ncbi:MAG: hypothetical protein CVU11_01485 [Bacteroidetes bacterium HGW-Bacteroidetes-6]|jgi:PBP1b-binding outer membrane lipoprotein LpoB|nr:MAG: hypothetical protein CVU11_01485 [Bacteroidetes bacterium HGW-Bacteroidetes-6]